MAAHMELHVLKPVSCCRTDMAAFQFALVTEEYSCTERSIRQTTGNKGGLQAANCRTAQRILMTYAGSSCIVRKSCVVEQQQAIPIPTILCSKPALQDQMVTGCEYRKIYSQHPITSPPTSIRLASVCKTLPFVQEIKNIHQAVVPHLTSWACAGQGGL